MASSPSRLRVNQRRLRRCETQKVGYQTYTEALDVAERMMALGHVEVGCHIVPYRCDACQEWHVGNHRLVWTSSVE